MSNAADQHPDELPDATAEVAAVEGHDSATASSVPTDGPPSGYAFSLTAILVQITVLAGIFALLKAMSVAAPERWMAFMTCGMGVVTWWALSIRSAQNREQFVSGKSQQTPAEIAQSQMQAAWNQRLAELAPEFGLDRESLAFLVDSIHFAPNYFAEEDGRRGKTRPLTENRLLLAVVRYARECFGDNAEQQLSDWGLHNRHRLTAILRELVAKDVAAPGTLGYEIRIATPALKDLAT